MGALPGCGSVHVGGCPHCKGKHAEAFRVDVSQCLPLILKVFSKNVCSTTQQTHMAPGGLVMVKDARVGMGVTGLGFNLPAPVETVN